MPTVPKQLRRVQRETRELRDAVLNLWSSVDAAPDEFLACDLIDERIADIKDLTQRLQDLANRLGAV